MTPMALRQNNPVIPVHTAAGMGTALGPPSVDAVVVRVTLSRRSPPPTCGVLVGVNDRVDCVAVATNVCVNCWKFTEPVSGALKETSGLPVKLTLTEFVPVVGRAEK